MKFAVKSESFLPLININKKLGLVRRMQKPNASNDEFVISLATFVQVDANRRKIELLFPCSLEFFVFEYTPLLLHLCRGLKQIVGILDFGSCACKRCQTRQFIKVLLKH